MIFWILLSALVLLGTIAITLADRPAERGGATRLLRSFIIFFNSGWIEVMFLAAALAIYFFFRSLEGMIAGGFLVLAIIAVAFRLVFRLIRDSNLTSRWNQLMVAVLFVPFAIVATLSVVRIGTLIVREVKNQKSFEERVDPFVHGAEQVYNTGDWPSWIYRLLHEGLFKGTYVPELFDSVRRYERYDATFYHFGPVGVTSYECSGKAYPSSVAESDTAYFLIQAEQHEPDSRVDVAVVDNLTGEVIVPKKQPVFISGTNATLAQMSVGNEFDFTRISCTSNAMTTKTGDEDGFVFDLGHIGHPPDSSRIVVVTDRPIAEARIVRMEPGSSFWDWLLARPKFVERKDAIPLEPSLAESVRSNFRDKVNHHVRNAAGEDSSVKHVELPYVWTGLVKNAGAGDIYLVRYRLQ